MKKYQNGNILYFPVDTDYNPNIEYQTDVSTITYKDPKTNKKLQMTGPGLLEPATISATLPDINSSKGKQIARNMAYRINNGKMN